MIRGTTKPLRIKFPRSVEGMGIANIYFSQHGEVILKKTLPEITVEGDIVIVPFTQEETLAFSSDERLFAQCRFKLDGVFDATKIFSVPVYPLLSDEVLA